MIQTNQEPSRVAGGGNVIVENSKDNPLIVVKSNEKTLRRIRFLEIALRI
jgi:hypothetical protein